MARPRAKLDRCGEADLVARRLKTDPAGPGRERLLPLPADSPELNPSEGLWDQIKDTYCNQVFATLAELESVLVVERQRFWQDARRVRSLIFDWLLAQANTSSATIIPAY